MNQERVRVDEVAKPFTVPSLAARWECSEGLIRKMIERGELNSFRIGVLIRVPADEVERIECKNTPSSGFADRSPSYGEKMECAEDEGFTPKIGRARRPRPGEFGKTGMIHHGPWAGS